MKICDINWGDDSAEKDRNLLEYFVDAGILGRLTDKSKSIVVGRKGAGKSALRKKLEENFSKEDDTFVINIAPKYTSLRIVLNDKDLVDNFGEEIFFQHTWLRQILLDCLCKVGDANKGKYVSSSVEFARTIARELKKTSKDFVENITELLCKVKLSAGNLGDFGLRLEKELRSVAEIDTLEFHISEISKSGYKFVILIDDLDLGWNNSLTANNLLLGLLSASNYLSAITENIYSCVFLREDVYSILISKTQHSDKYRNVERIRWQKDNLLRVLNNRINFNRKQNGFDALSDPFTTVFPPTIGTSNTDNWLLDRTLSRPRELIQLARYYTENVDSASPDDAVLKASEKEYSSWKLDDLCTEYSNQYPGLIDVFSYWKTKYFRTKYHLKRDEIEEMLLQVAVDVNLDAAWFNDIVDKMDLDNFLKILYEIGFIGDFVLGGEGGSKTVYSHEEKHEPLFKEIQIHPCFRKAVGTVDRIYKS